MRRRDFLGLAAGAVAGTAVAGCADVSADTAPVVSDRSPIPPTRTPARTVAPTHPAPTPTAPATSELGVIPVLMHHRLVANASGDYDMTPAFFRAELERLYREKYHPIRTIDLVHRDFSTVPAGKTPVVLTFDDGSPGQFALDAAGKVKPDCAVGMMLAFHAEHPDFPAIGSFYVNKNPFGYSGTAADRALRQLHQLGCEIGNHTLTHPNLRNLTDNQVRAEIGQLSALVAHAIPAAPPRTLALPLGVHPRNRSTLVAGGHGSTAYRNEAVLLVGANPCPSPFHQDFDPMSIPRIRCSSHDGGRGELEQKYWLDRLAAKPTLRYIAAGNH